MRVPNFAIALAGMLAGAAALPSSASLVQPAMSAPNTINNATIDPAPATGVYDLEDRYRDSQGFPLPGWEHLTRPPS
jgi:hypothetical protein